MLKSHRKQESTVGRVVHPAAVQQCRSSTFAAAENRKCDCLGQDTLAVLALTGYPIQYARSWTSKIQELSHR